MRRNLARRRPWLVAAAGLAVVAAVAVWVMFPPGALSFAGGHALSLGEYQGTSPVGVPAELSSGDLVARGKYLTQAADCEVCHTREGGQRFAGGRAFKTPFGVLYSPNITPDPETGIGTWSDADFLRAVHDGVAKDGQGLYPAFPYESYTLIADADVLAIKAYLFSLPGVRTTVPPNGLTFPFNQRWLMRIWAAFYNPDQRFRPREGRSDEWNRGAYLVEALGHCGDCHTPRNLGQALNNRRKFAGTVTAGWRAYNITSDRTSGIGDWSDRELAEYLQSGRASGHGAASGPMAEEVSASSSTWTSGDIHAAITYLRSIPAIRTRDLPPVKSALASDSPKVNQASADPLGRQTFQGACVSCHAWNGVSLVNPYATLTGGRAVNDPTGINVAQIVLTGEHWHSGDEGVVMPAFGDAYSDFEIAAVANYVIDRFGAGASKLTAKDVARLRQQ